MEKQNAAYPYKTLGIRLKRLRENSRQSVAEVSGAVEIDTGALHEFEQGIRRPAEDILLLLISHFELKDDDATKLWELAGYEQKSAGTEENIDTAQAAQTFMVFPMEARIVYTDTMHLMMNDYGVVLNFMQVAGPNNQQVAVARVGMSKEHAKSMLELLQKTLSQPDQKSLPSSNSNAKRKAPKKTDK